MYPIEDTESAVEERRILIASTQELIHSLAFIPKHNLIAPPGVDVATDMQLGSRSPAFSQQMRAAQPVHIEVILWRSVSNQDIDTLRHCVTPSINSLRIGECPICWWIIGWYLWSRVNMQRPSTSFWKLQPHLSMLEIMDVAPVKVRHGLGMQQRSPGSWIQVRVMVTSDDDLLLVRKALEPVNLLLQVCHGASLIGSALQWRK